MSRLGHLGGVMQKQYTQNTSSDLAYNVAGIAFLVLTVVFGVLFIKDSMENLKYREAAWEAMDKRIEAREALNSNQ